MSTIDTLMALAGFDRWKSSAQQFRAALEAYGQEQYERGHSERKQDAKPVARIDPMQDPMRPGYCMNYAENETPAEMVLRKLACWLGVGGYNTPKVDAEVFHRKIVDGVQMLLAGASPPKREQSRRAGGTGGSNHSPSTSKGKWT